MNFKNKMHTLISSITSTTSTTSNVIKPEST